MQHNSPPAGSLFPCTQEEQGLGQISFSKAIENELYTWTSSAFKKTECQERDIIYRNGLPDTFAQGTTGGETTENAD